jgi:8-oxo-dGTP pyrophosphatase MutT (NUDIX family)
MKCTKCHQEFTEQDKSQVNYNEFMGKYSHRMCPGTACAICGEEIADFSQAKKGACGQGWQHNSCKPTPIRPQSAAIEQALRDEMEEEAGYDASSWIVRH